jgi:hypothetical protein
MYIRLLNQLHLQNKEGLGGNVVVMALCYKPEGRVALLYGDGMCFL